MTAAREGGWTLRYSRRAEKDIARLDPPIRRRILNALDQLAEDPSSVSGLRKLSGRSESRLRVGVAAGAGQHLSALHDAIQEAFGWFDDHLYSFWLNGEFYGGEEFEYTSPRSPTRAVAPPTCRLPSSTSLSARGSRTCSTSETTGESASPSATAPTQMVATTRACSISRALHRPSTAGSATSNGRP